MATSEMDSAHILTKDTNILADEPKKVLYCVVKRNNVGYISPRFKIVYSRKVIRWVNEEEPKLQEQINVQESCDESFRPQPKEKKNLSQDRLVDVPKYLSHVSQDQYKIRNE